MIRNEYVPDAIIGDLDSLRLDVRKFYTARGAACLDEGADQDSTDLEKCLRYVCQRMATDAAARYQLESRDRSRGAVSTSAKDLVVVLGALSKPCWPCRCRSKLPAASMAASRF